MQISSRFTIAVHILTYIALYGEQETATSETLASSIGAHPVVVRRILGQLRRAGLIEVARGREGGAHIRQPLNQITLRAVFAAVESLGSHALFRFHENPNPACPIGKNIHEVLDGHLMEIQHAMEREMERVTLADVTEKAQALLK